MEDGLGADVQRGIDFLAESLNPCFSGGWSRSYLNCQLRGGLRGLNPCFSGGWSRRPIKKHLVAHPPQRSLNPCFSGGWSRRATFVSGCQRDPCNEFFRFVNFLRPKICTFLGVFIIAKLVIFAEKSHNFTRKIIRFGRKTPSEI